MNRALIGLWALNSCLFVASPASAQCASCKAGLAGGARKKAKPRRPMPKRPPKRIGKPDCECAEKCECGDECKCGDGKLCCPGCTCLIAPESNFGLDLYGMGKDCECGTGKKCPPKYSLNGKEITRAQAFQALREADIPADSGKRRLTIIGSEGDRAKVLSDLKTHPALAKYKDNLVIQSYPREAPLIKEVGFEVDGKPSIYLQSARGEVLGRNLDGSYPGPEKLAEALRRTDASYDPKKDPDLVPPPALPGLPSLPWGSIPPLAYVLAGGGALLLLSRKGAN